MIKGKLCRYQIPRYKAYWKSDFCRHENFKEKWRVSAIKCVELPSIVETVLSVTSDTWKLEPN